MSSFKKTTVKCYPRQGIGLTPDNIYWRNLKFPVTAQEYGLVDLVDFSRDGDFFAVTSSVNVKLYSSATNLVVKSFSKFTKAAFSGRFRGDGRLLCAGSEDNTVRLFDVDNKHLLRHFKGHQAPVHRCCFTADGYRVVSCSDDRSVALWDVGAEAELTRLRAHTDYVRAGASSPVGVDLLASASYDHTVRVWDARAAANNACTMRMDHGAPVEALLFFPSGALLVSTGGSETRVWDLVAGGRMVTALCNHTKTVTCATLCCAGTRLVTGGLDRRLKIYDTTNYQLVHSLDYSSPVLSLAIAPDDSKVVVGMADGLVSMRDRKPSTESQETAMMLSHEIKADASTQDDCEKSARLSPANRAEVKISRSGDNAKSGAAGVLEPYDQHLRRFQYSLVLDRAMERAVTRRRPECTVAVLQQLRRRGVLRTALAGRNANQVQRVCRFLGRYLSDPRFTAPIVDVVAELLEVYGSQAGRGDTELDLALSALSRAVDTQIDCVSQMLHLQGGLDMVLAGAGHDASTVLTGAGHDASTAVSASIVRTST